MILACAVCAPFARRSRVLRSPSLRRSRASSRYSHVWCSLSRYSRAVSFARVIALSTRVARVVPRVVRALFRLLLRVIRMMSARWFASRSRVSRVLFERRHTSFVCRARRSCVSRALPRVVRAYRTLSARYIKLFAYNHSCQLINYLFNRPLLK